MPTYSTLRAVTLALVATVPYVQGTVVVPFEAYLGPGPGGIPDDYVRYTPANRSGIPGAMPMHQNRVGVRLAIGVPPQHVFVPPHFFDSETYVKGLGVCDGVPSMDLSDCESEHSGLFNVEGSTTFEADGSFGTDTVTVFDATPDLMNDKFRFGVIEDGNVTNFAGEKWGTLGLGAGSTFLKTFFPDNEQIGIYYNGGNSTFGKPPPSSPPRPLVIYELEFDGYNQSHFTGEKYTQPIGPPSPLSNSTNPFTLNVTGIKVGNQDILGGESYIATVDLIGRTSNVLPTAVFNAFINATGANGVRSGLPEYNSSLIPTDPDEWYNLTITFSNGHTTSIPQWALINDYSFMQPDLSMANILDVGDPFLLSTPGVRGPVISLNQLIFSSYIGIDHAAGEWWLAEAVHNFDGATDLPPKNTNTTDPEKNAAAGGFGGNLKKTVMSAAALAVAVAMF